MLELQVAFIVLGIALAGLFPLLVMQSRHLRRLESRLDSARTYYLIPSSDPWARKLGCGARISVTPPPPPPPPPVTVIDNGASGYSEEGGGWQSESRSDSYGGSNRYHVEGQGANSANFTFTNLQPGWYEVWATWSPGSDRATNAPFTVYDGNTIRGTFPVKQKTPPKTAQFGGRPWDRLGIVPLAGTTLLVRLTDQADETVIADGVRLVALRNTVSVSSFDHTVGLEEVTAQVHLTLVTP